MRFSYTKTLAILAAINFVLLYLAAWIAGNDPWGTTGITVAPAFTYYAIGFPIFLLMDFVAWRRRKSAARNQADLPYDADQSR